MTYNVLDTVLRIFAKGPSLIHILLSLLNVRKPKSRSVENLKNLLAITQKILTLRFKVSYV